MIVLLILQSFASSAFECELPNFYAGNLNLTSENQYKDFIAKNEVFLLGISAKWCTRCCVFEPALSEIAKTIEEKKNIKLIRADISTQTYLNKYIEKNEALPHLYLVHKGLLKRYDYPIGSYLLEYIEKYLSPHILLTTEQEIDDFLTPSENDYIIVVGFIFDTEDDFLSIYESIPRTLIDWPNTKFGLVTDKSLIKSLKSQNKHTSFLNSIVVHTKGKTKVQDLEMDKNIKDFIIYSSIGTLEELNTFTFQIYKTIGLPLLVLFIDKEKANHYQYLSIFEKVAREYSSIKFV